jgi:hypothetical protein
MRLRPHQGTKRKRRANNLFGVSLDVFPGRTRLPKARTGAKTEVERLECLRRLEGCPPKLQRNLRNGFLFIWISWYGFGLPRRGSAPHSSPGNATEMDREPFPRVTLGASWRSLEGIGNGANPSPKQLGLDPTSQPWGRSVEPSSARLVM